jgi:hypothetical protein
MLTHRERLGLHMLDQANFMWVRKSPTEAVVQRWARWLCPTGLDVLLGVGLWFVFVRLFVVFGKLPRDLVSSGVACAVFAVILPAAWYDNRRRRRKRNATLVCDVCNIVKVADGQLRCQCGGHYHCLADMKWAKTKLLERIIAEETRERRLGNRHAVEIFPERGFASTDQPPASLRGVRSDGQFSG